MKKILLIFLLIAIGNSGAQTPSATKYKESISFCGEDDCDPGEPDPFAHSIPISADVLRALLDTKEVHDTLQGEDAAKHPNPSKLFQAVEAHLGGPNEVDLVIRGLCPMRGADNSWFCIVRSSHNHPKVVLFSNTLALDLLNNRTNGFNDIRSSWASAAQVREQVFRFDGQQYRLWKENWKPNK